MNMILQNAFLFSLLSCIILSTDVLYAHSFHIEYNKYSDPIICLHSDSTQQDLLDAIQNTPRSFFVQVPYECGLLVSILTHNGCTVYHADNERILFKKEIDRELPNPYTCKSGTNVLITKKVDGRLYALFTIEQGKPNATWPGGMLRPGERMRMTGVRECKEEIGLDIDPQEMRFMGVLHRINDPYGATMHEYLFHVPYNGQEIIPDGKEVLEAVWVPVDEAIAGFAAGRPIREHKRQLLEAIYNGKFGTICLELPEWPSLDQEKDDVVLRDFYPTCIK